VGWQCESWPSQGAPSRKPLRSGAPALSQGWPRAHPAELQVRLGDAPLPCRCGPRPSQGAPLHFSGCACNIPGRTQRSSRRALGARLCHPRARLVGDLRPHKAHPGAVNPAQRAPCAISLRLCALCAPVGRGTKPLVQIALGIPWGGLVALVVGVTRTTGSYPEGPIARARQPFRPSALRTKH
jgi:hypothetical protein